MKKKCCLNFRNYIREYCKNSSIHGLQYVGEKERTYCERFCWFLIFLTCLTGCGYAIYAVYVKWDESPVIINFANSGTQIFTIPFPAVTLCPEAKLNEEKFSFTKIKQKIDRKQQLTPLEDMRLQYMSLLCNPLENYYYKDLYISDDFYDVLNELEPRFFLEKCSFMDQSFKCEDHFKPIITEEGICYTFNMFGRNILFRDKVVFYNKFWADNTRTDWTIHHSYNTKNINVYPNRATLAGAKNGLNFNIVTAGKNSDYACGRVVQGYRVMLYTPATVPWPGQKFFRVPLHQSVVASIQPSLVTTSKTIALYSPKLRKCYLEGEKFLKYFKDYTFSNCKRECLTNFTLTICGCVKYFMPRENGTKICSTRFSECLAYAEKLMQLNHVATKLNDTHIANQTINMLESHKINQCRCLPTCSDLTYKAEITQTDWEWTEFVTNNYSISKNRTYKSSVNLYFPSDDFFSSERNELYGPLDFLANFGGLLGLFTGFSILSLMEIIYFLTIRIICNLHLFGRLGGPEQ